MSSEPKPIPPVVEALAAFFDGCGDTATHLRGHPRGIAAIITEHQPPDKLDDLLAAMREYDDLAPGNDERVCVIFRGGHGNYEYWNDGLDLAAWPVPSEAAAAIRAATEELKAKAEFEPTPEPTDALEAFHELRHHWETTEKQDKCFDIIQAALEKAAKGAKA